MEGKKKPSFETFYLTHMESVKFYKGKIIRICGHEEWRDLVHDAMIILHSKYSEVEAPDRYLYRIIDNLLIKYHSKKTRRGRSNVDVYEMSNLIFESENEVFEAKADSLVKRINEALDLMTPERRNIAESMVFTQLDQEKLCELYGIKRSLYFEIQKEFREHVTKPK